MTAEPVGESVIIDIIEDARWIEQSGVVTEIARRAIMQHDGIPPNPLDSMLGLTLNSTLLPSAGDPHPHRPELTLFDRTVTALSPTIASILLIYKLPITSGQFPPGQSYVIEGGGSVEQISTAIDRGGSQITVEHEGVVQGGEITPLNAVEDMSVRTSIQTVFPPGLVRDVINRVNSGAWTNFDPFATPRTWLVSDVSYSLEDRGIFPPRYSFTYTFRKNTDMWDPQVVYIDPETGKPPSGLVANVGFKTVPWHFLLNFNTAFPF